jgi:hypothetical protein
MTIQNMYVVYLHPFIDFLRKYLTSLISTNLNHGKGYLTSSDTLGGWNSSVGVGTRYRPDGSLCESQWGARLFPHVQTGLGAYPTSCTMGARSFPWLKRPGRGVYHPPHLALRFRKEYNYRFSPLLLSSWLVIG